MFDLVPKIPKYYHHYRTSPDIRGSFFFMPTFAPDFGQQTIPESDVLGYFMSALGSKKRKEAKEKTIRIVCFNFLKYFINLKKKHSYGNDKRRHR